MFVILVPALLGRVGDAGPDRRRLGDAPLVGATVFYGWAVYIVSPPVVLTLWPANFDTGNQMTCLYVGGLLAGDLALALLYRAMAREEGATHGAV